MTQTTGQQPFVLDVKDEAWPPPNLEQVQAWLRAEGIDPDITTRVEVLPSEAGPVATVHQWKLNEAGRLYCPLDHDHEVDAPEACEVASVVREVRVSCLPPEAGAA